MGDKVGATRLPRSGPTLRYSLIEQDEIGHITIHPMEPLFYDACDRVRAAGAFVLVDEAICETPAPGTILAQ